MAEPVERRFQVRSSTHSLRASWRDAVVWMATIASWQPRPGRNPVGSGSNRASHSGSSAFHRQGLKRPVSDHGNPAALGGARCSWAHTPA